MREYPNNSSGLDFYVDNCGAVGDATLSGTGTDDTAAFAAAIQGAAIAFSTVRASGKNYLINGSITIPTGVTLQGTYNGMLSHSRDYAPFWGAGHDLARNTGGSNLFITGGHGNASAPATFTLTTNAKISGFQFYYPKQVDANLVDPANGQTLTAPIVYPWTIRATRANNVNVSNIELFNAYNGVFYEQVHRGYIGGVTGQPLQTGIFCAGGGDVNRLENNHFGAWNSYAYDSVNKALGEYVNANATAYKIGREDALNMDNCFAYGYGIGGHFIRTAQLDGDSAPVASPDPWVELTGCSFDACNKNIVIERAQSRGIIIKGGQFINTLNQPVVTIGPDFTGRLQISNAYMWSDSGKYVKYEGAGMVSLEDVLMTATDADFETTNTYSSSIGVDASTSTGVLKVNNCIFNEQQVQVSLGPGLKRASIQGNIFAGIENITNNMTGRYEIKNNTDSGSPREGAVTPQAALVYDEFTGVAGTNLSTHTPDIGTSVAKYWGQNGNLLLDGAGKLYYSAGAGVDAGYTYAPAFSGPDQRAELSLQFSSHAQQSNDIIGLVIRGVDSGGGKTGYEARIDRNDAGDFNLQLFVWNNGAATLLHNATLTGFTVNTSYLLALSITGTTLNLKWNGADYHTVSNTVLPGTNRNVAITAYSATGTTGWLADYLKVYDIISA